VAYGCGNQRKQKGRPNGTPLDQSKKVGSDRFVDPALQGSFWGCARPVGNNLAVLKDEQRRDATHAHGGGSVGVAVNINLGNFDLAFVLDGQLFQSRADLFSWAAPFGPEIHHNGDIGILDFCVKCGVRNGNGRHVSTPERDMCWP
jgi:hypothetical protein